MDIRAAARAAKVPLWKIADELGVSELTVSRRLRHELPDLEKEELFSIIKRIGGDNDGKAAPNCAGNS